MKRLICLILTLLLCLGFISCGGVDASQTYIDAKEKTDTLKSFDATMEMSVEFEENRGTRSELNIKLDRSNPDAPVYHKIYNINDLSLGEKYVTSVYYADNVVYEMDGSGEKYKAQVALESIESSFSSVAVDLPKEIFESAEVEGKLVSADADASKLSDLLGSFMAGTSTYYTSLNEDGSFDFKYSDVEVEFATDENGYFSFISIECDVDFKHATGDAEADIFMKVTYNNPGSEVKITAPSDLSEYTWYEGSDKTQEELEAEMMDEILALFNFEDGKATRVSNFDELYIVACSKYGKESVDMYVETIEMLGGLSQ